MRWVLFGILLALATDGRAQARPNGPVHANNILVLIQPALAGPNVDPLNFWQPQWVLWPLEVRDGDGGSLLSIATGDNWVGDPADYHFDPAKVGVGWVARNYAKMRSRGIFAIRKASLGDIRTDLLVGVSGSASPNALRLCLNDDSASVRPYRIDDAVWPSKSLMVAEASGWDEVRDFLHSTAGRVLVVEYPPKHGIQWTRYWLQGHSWEIDHHRLDSNSFEAVVPKQFGLPVPGLIRARLLIPLVMNSAGFEASAITAQQWQGANRFFEVCRSNGFIVGAVWLVFISAVVVWGVVVVSNERSAHVAPVLLVSLLLSPAIFNLAGQLGRTLGVEQWPIWICLSCVLLVMGAYALANLQRRFLVRAHPLLGVFVVGLSTMCAINPIWSFMSPLFNGRSSSVSSIAMGAVLGYMTGVVLCLRGCGQVWTWCGRCVCALFLVLGLAFRAWWIEDLGASLFIPVAAAVVGEGFFRWSMLTVFGIWPTSLIPLFVRGFIWAPLGLLESGNDTAGINLATYMDFVSSPSLGLFLLVAGGTALFGYRFFFHQMRMLGKLDPRRKGLPCVAIAGASFGVLHPSFLAASLVLGTGATAALLFDGVQAM